MAGGPSHTKPWLPALEDVAAMIRAGEFAEDIALTFDRASRTLRDSLRRAGWDPDTGFELVEQRIDLAEIVAAVADATWIDAALCAQIDDEPFFPETGGVPKRGKKLCVPCVPAELRGKAVPQPTPREWVAWRLLRPRRGSGRRHERPDAVPADRGAGTMVS